MIFDPLRKTWSYEKIFHEQTRNSPFHRDNDKAKRIRSQIARLKKDEREYKEKRRKKARKLFKKGKTVEALKLWPM